MSSNKRGNPFRHAALICLLGLISIVGTVEVASAQGEPAPTECAGPGECLCDNAYQDCRTPLLNLIKNETQGIAVSMWFMTDFRYSSELIKRKNAGIDVRVILDLQADTNYPANKTERERMLAAGIPARDCIASKINHWKAMIFKGQGKVQFSAANFANGSFSPTVTPYVTYVDEAIYFTDDPAVVKTFMRRFDEHWLNTTEFQSLGSFPLVPMFEGSNQFPLDPDMNFVPNQYYEDRLRPQVALEDPLKNPDAAIDAVMFRITSGKIPETLITRKRAGVPIRIVTDRGQYRNTKYFWHSYNIDRMYAEGRRSDGSCEFPPCIEVKWKNTSLTDQDMHQKSIILHTRGAAVKAPMVVFGSANWTSSSNSGQREHNYFTRKTWMVEWFIDQFNRKWNNLKADGSPIGQSAFVDYVPGFPETPVYSSPANDALAQSTTPTLKWEGGWWAHKYDIYISTSSNPTSAPIYTLLDYMPGSTTAGVKSTKESLIIPASAGLQPGTLYYWVVRGKTMANKTKLGPVWRFTTAGGVPPPPAPSGLTATAMSNSRIDLAWTDVAGEDGYKIERKLTSSSTWTQIAQTSADVVSYADTSGLSPGTGYNYRVRAFTSGGNSGYSNTATATTPMVTLSVGDVVLYTKNAAVTGTKWKVVNDPTAAGGAHISNANLGAATVTAPVAQPADYFEMQFTATKGIPYRLWMRGKAASNNGYNDSVWVQVSNATNANGVSIDIGATNFEWVNLQDCSGATLNGWGWQDNWYASTPCGALGPRITFATEGAQTIRVQVREDGASFDQIVLSPDTYLNVSPGATKADTVILPEQGGSSGGGPPPPPEPTASTDVVLYSKNADVIGTTWQVVTDSTAAGGARISNANRGAATVATPLEQPPDYFEMQFTVTEDTPYRLWMRGTAARNNGYDDSVWVQFSDAVNANGVPINIETTKAEWVNLQDCSGASLNGWGWQDNGYAGGSCGFLGPVISFPTPNQTIRVQAREDGVSIDQIVLSRDTYLNASPGATKADTVILPEQTGGS